MWRLPRPVFNVIEDWHDRYGCAGKEWHWPCRLYNWAMEHPAKPTAAQQLEWERAMEWLRRQSS